MKTKFFTRCFEAFHSPSFILATFFILTTLSAHAQVTPKYNVLFIAVDDMNDRCSFLGNTEVVSPNLQRLVKRGMVFKNAYTQYAMCNPSRTSLLSGWRPDKTHIFSNSVRPSSILGPDVVYLPMYFEKYGYHTERYGKIMHGLFENDCKWDYAEPPERTDGNLMFSNDKVPSTLHPGAEWWIKNVPDSTTDDGIEAKDLANRLRQPQPPFFFYGFGLHTHNPFTPSLQYWNMNGDASTQIHLPVDKNGTLSPFTGNGSANIILPETPLNDRADIPSVAFSANPILKTGDDWRNVIHAYDGEVAQMDAQLGIVLDELDRQNLWQNTVIVFWSDHGQHLGEHEGTWLKNTVFEEALHVPLIVCVPGKPAGECTQLVELVDLYPTLAEICGLPAPPDMEGYSFAPLLDNPNLPWKRAVFSQVKRSGTLMGRSIRTNQYRYTSWDTAEELYDHIADPHEYTNLALKPEYASVLNEMRTILSDGWTKSLPPQCSLNATISPAGSISVCKGNSITLSANIGSGIQYQWLKNGTIISNATSQIFIASREGNYQVSETDSLCTSLSTSAIISLTGKSQATITSLGSLDICGTGSVTLEANNGSGLIYQWQKNDNIISGATKRKYTATATGSYTVTITDSSGCSKTSVATIVTNSCSLFSSKITNASSLKTVEKIIGYPNPSHGEITIIYYSEKNSNVFFKVYDERGNIAFQSTEFALRGRNVKALHLSNLSSGVYYVVVNDNAEQQRFHFIISK